MAYGFHHLDERFEINQPLEELERLYNELEAAERGDSSDCVAVTHDSEWGLEANCDGMLVLHHEWHGSMHMRNVSKQRVLNLWRLLAEGDLKAIKKQPWQKGEGFLREPNVRLTADQVKRGRAVYAVLGKFFAMRYSKFEVAVLRRGEAEETVRHWERVSASFQKYRAEHLLNERQEQGLFTDLCEIAFNAERTLAAARKYWEELAATYNATGEFVTK